MKKNHYWILVLLLVLVMAVTIISPIKTQAQNQTNSPSLTGTYKVYITAHQGSVYYTKIGVEALPSGKIKITGNFDGIPLVAIGYQTESRPETITYVFKVRIPNLFNGTANIGFQYQNNNYQLSGKGKGTYSYLGASGQGSARITGERISSSLPNFRAAAIPAFFTFVFKPLLFIGLIVILILLYRRVRQSHSKGFSIIRLGLLPCKLRNMFSSQTNPGFKFHSPLDRTSWFNIILILGLFLTALAVRLPWLWEVPRYIDELKEVMLAYSIYTGKAIPLHNSAHDIGSMHNFILAGIFKLFGSSIYWPRLYVAVTAALTVVLLYFLGAKLYDRGTGLLAAGLLLTNGMHILVTHKAWANCTTPFFFVLAMLATINAEQKKSGPWLAMAGLLWAATLQTHSSVIIYLIVIFIYVLSGPFRRGTQINIGWYITAMLIFLAGYSNMIYYNIKSAGGSFSWLAHKQYALEIDPGIHSFFSNLVQMIIQLVRTVSSTYGSENYISHYLLHPFFLLSLILIVAGGYLTLRKRIYLPVWMLIGGFAILPWINHRYDFYLATRYIMPLVLCAILLMAYAAKSLLTMLLSPIRYKRFITIAAGTLLLTLISYQLVIFYQYCSRVQNTNLSNRTALQIMSIIRKDYSQSPIVLVDQNLPLENQPLPDLLTISEINYAVIPANEEKQNINEWVQLLERYPQKRVIAIMEESNYLAIEKYLTRTKTYSLYSQVLFPGNIPFQRVIYVVEKYKDS